MARLSQIIVNYTFAFVLRSTIMFQEETGGGFPLNLFTYPPIDRSEDYQVYKYDIPVPNFHSCLLKRSKQDSHLHLKRDPQVGNPDLPLGTIADTCFKMLQIFKYLLLFHNIAVLIYLCKYLWHCKRFFHYLIYNKLKVNNVF